MKRLILLLAIIPAITFAQCPENDGCETALQINIDSTYSFCNYGCIAELDGNPWEGFEPCASQELDFWLTFTITEYDTYTIKYYNDYQHPSIPEYYGAQIFLYETNYPCSAIVTGKR